MADFTLQYDAFCTNVVFDGCSITQLNMVCCCCLSKSLQFIKKARNCGPFLISKSL